MTFMNSSANIRQFAMLGFVNENSSDDHVISKISIVLRRDKIEAPYYMDVKIRISTCLDRAENGMIHAMDLLNHNRMHNLTEEKYSEIKALAENITESDRVKIFTKDKRLKIVITSRSRDEMEMIFKEYGELLSTIDGLVD